MRGPRYPSLYEVNTRVWLAALTRDLGRPVTLDDVPTAEVDRIADLGFDWCWLLGVWQPSPAAREVSFRHEAWRQEFLEALPDLEDDDIAGSGFAIPGYRVSAALGGTAALARLRERLRAAGLRLMLDFVPNHTAPDHPWTLQHPEFYVEGSEEDLLREPGNYVRVDTGEGPRILARGRDPHFPAWPDTLQLNYGNPALREAMGGELLAVAGQCDGVRCDMAMLVLPEVFERTWGTRAGPFWPQAIRAVRERYPDFTLLAEVYWDLEWTLQQQGFDYAYDKRLYDRLRAQQGRPVRAHLFAGLEFQDRLARFLENHDEPRAARVFPLEVHRAAALVAYLTPGLRFFHQGQLEGHRARIPTHLARGPRELPDDEVGALYRSVLEILRREVVREGRWRLLECAAAWDGNGTWDGFIAWVWEGAGDERLMVVVNYAPNQSQCYVRLPFPDLGGRSWRLRDLLGPACYEREGDELAGRGLYLDLPPWGHHVFEVTGVATPVPARGGTVEPDGLGTRA